MWPCDFCGTESNIKEVRRIAIPVVPWWTFAAFNAPLGAVTHIKLAHCTNCGPAALRLKSERCALAMYSPLTRIESMRDKPSWQ